MATLYFALLPNSFSFSVILAISLKGYLVKLTFTLAISLAFTYLAKLYFATLPNSFSFLGNFSYLAITLKLNS